MSEEEGEAEIEPVQTDRADQKPQRKGWKVAGCFVGVIVLAILSIPLVAVLKGATSIHGMWEKGKELVDETVAGVKGTWTTSEITAAFADAIPEVAGNDGDILEVSTVRAVELFRRKDERRIIWNTVYLGTTVVEIRTPVTFRYHIKLTDEWKLATREDTCLVLAPELHPSLPPAIHTDEMEKRVNRGWARFNEEEALTAVEKSMTPILVERAGDEGHLALVREHSRESIAEFVKTWLMTEDQWRPDRFTSIVVYFPDEVDVETAAELETLKGDPTIQLE